MTDARIDIGIDGGGTGCRVVVSVPDGAQTRAQGQAANIVTDPAGAEAAIRLALTEALGAQGLGFEDMANARVCAGLAGGRLPGVADAFATRLPFLAYVVDDSVTAFEGALDGADGTLASLGTGSFFVRKSAGALHHIGGWGLSLGDEGSAAWLGRRALSLALRVQDGRLAPDPLAEALFAATPPHPVLFARDASPGDFAQLAHLVLEHQETALRQRLWGEVIAALQEGLNDLGWQAGEALVITGGLGDLLVQMLPNEIRDAARPAQGPALEGALRLARGLP